MELTDFIRLGSQDPPLRFLIIGGYAVAAHGYARATFDVDLLVRRSDREAWVGRLGTSGLTSFGQTNAFVQFSQPGDGDGLDLMFVDEVTFTRMWQASEDHEFGGVHARIPCLDHLLALKLHALKQALPHRTSRDAEDVRQLAIRHRIDLGQPHYKELFLKYATPEIYETFLRLLRDE